MQQVICHKCRCPNHFGTVFCKNCGQKLREQDVTHPDRQPMKKFQKLMVKVFKLALLFAVIGLFAAFFITAGLPVPKTISDPKETELLNKKCREIDEAQAKNKPKLFVLTAEQATYLVNQLIDEDRKISNFEVGPDKSMPKLGVKGIGTSGPGAMGGANIQADRSTSLKPQPSSKPPADSPPPPPPARQKGSPNDNIIPKRNQITVKLGFMVDSKQQLTIVMTGILLEYIPYRFEVAGDPVVIVDEKDPQKKEIRFEAKSFRIGHVQIPMALKQQMVDLFMKMLLSNPRVGGYLAAVKDIKIESEEVIEVTVSK